MNIQELVAALPELYQPIYGHPQLSRRASRICEDRFKSVSTICTMLSNHLHRPLRILDLGCAQGYFSFKLAELGYEVTGIEVLEENLQICRALQAKNPHLRVKFIRADISETLRELVPGKFDLVLGLSVLHHLCHDYGKDTTRELVRSARDKTEAAVFEIALSSEPLYWAPHLPDDPRWLLQDWPFVHIWSEHPTHVSDVRRPIFICSAKHWILGDSIESFHDWSEKSHEVAGNAFQRTRRYFFSADKIAKLFFFEGALKGKNRLELEAEIAFLSSPPKDFHPIPRLYEGNSSTSEGWIVAERLPGIRLSQAIAHSVDFDPLTVLRDILKQLSVLESYGLFHNDVRTWNVFLTETGTATLLDYGSITPTKRDCTWPFDLTLSFFLFASSVLARKLPHIEPSRPPLMPPFIGPFSFPPPYDRWAAYVWNRPPKSWTFALLRDALELAVEGSLDDELCDTDASAGRLWMLAIQEYLNGLSQYVVELGDIASQTRDTITEQLKSIQELLRREDAIRESAKRVEAERDQLANELVQAQEMLATAQRKIAEIAQSLEAEQRRLEEETKQKAQLNVTVEEKDRCIRELVQVAERQRKELDRIYNSHGWKALLAYYNLRNAIFPPGSRRQFVAQKIFHAVLCDRKTPASDTGHERIVLKSPLYSTDKPVAQQALQAAACTIISKNYIAFARTLAHSFRTFHPNIPFFVLLVDRLDGYFDPRNEPFEMVGIEELDIRDLTKFCFKYNILELNTAVKPYFLSYLFRTYGIGKLIYLDPDILITKELADAYALLDQYAIVLVPHITAPLDDDREPSELDILRAGVFNLGFLGLVNNPQLSSFLSWWATRVYEGCFMAPEKGMHVDQKWMDLAPSLYDGVYILRDPGYNVAYWNLHTRKIQYTNGTVSVNGGPCYFFHFSGFDPTNPSVVSKHQNRFSMKDIGDAARLFEHYAALVRANGYQDTKAWPYAFGSFDNGVAIPDIARRIYQLLGVERVRFGNPFSTTSKNSFFDWLNGPADGRQSLHPTISRLWAEIYATRADVQSAYPDVLGKDREAFSKWIETSGRHEHQIDERLVPRYENRKVSVLKRQSATHLKSQLYLKYLRPLENSLKIPLKQTIGRSKYVWTTLKTIRNSIIYPKPTFPNMPAARSTTVRPHPFGVNLAGYLRSEKGVGEAGRAAARALAAASIPHVLIDVVDSGSVNTVSGEFSDKNPYSVNLLHINADQVPIFACEKGEAFFKEHYNIGCWFWELSRFPERWYSSFAYFDELWAATSFIQDALSRVAPIPVIKMPLALSPESEIASYLTRQDFGLPRDKFVFLSILDFASVFERKNPLSLIHAFKLAFSNRDDALLVFKVTHSEQYPKESAVLAEACAGSNVLIIDQILSRQAMNTLLSLCDCYVSLHRSEGYGLPIAEAMALGKCAIVTAYSGNMDFTTPANSFLVKYRLTEIDRDYGPYQKGWVWAEPDIDHAAELMRVVYNNAAQAAEVGNRARQDIRELFHPNVVANQLRERLVRIGVAGATYSRPG